MSPEKSRRNLKSCTGNIFIFFSNRIYGVFILHESKKPNFIFQLWNHFLYICFLCKLIWDNFDFHMSPYYIISCRYVSNWWMNKIGARNFSVAGLQHKTNNALESMHRVSEIFTYPKHCSLFQFQQNELMHSCTYFIFLRT